MKKLAVPILGVLLVAGCGATSSRFIATPGAETLSPSRGFQVVQVDDRSGFKFGEADNDAFDLAAAMSDALKAELARQGLSSETAAYSVKVDILAYAPGNAFARWLMPGAGATKLTVEALIKDQNNMQVAKIPGERSISAGGGYTIGAYKYIFEDVAKELAVILKDPGKKKNAG